MTNSRNGSAFAPTSPENRCRQIGPTSAIGSGPVETRARHEGEPVLVRCGSATSTTRAIGRSSDSLDTSNCKDYQGTASSHGREDRAAPRASSAIGDSHGLVCSSAFVAARLRPGRGVPRCGPAGFKRGMPITIRASRFSGWPVNRSARRMGLVTGPSAPVPRRGWTARTSRRSTPGLPIGQAAAIRPHEGGSDG